MSETVILYELTGWGEGVIPQMEGLIERVGEFRRIQWCRTHDAEAVQNHGGESDECWRSVWAETWSKEGTGWPYELCRLVEVWQEVTPK